MSSRDDSSIDTNLKNSLIAGGASGLVSRLVVYPADTIKARLQIQGGLPGNVHYGGTFHAIQQVLLKEGPNGFYRGFSAVLIGILPANMAYFGGYEIGRLLLPGAAGFGRDAAVGAVAQLLAGVVFTPIDIIKERMQVQALVGSMYKYTGAVHALHSLVRQDGVAGLFRGYWATNCVWIPWNIMYIATYEQAKRRAASHLGLAPTEELPSWAVASCSAGAAAVAAVVTHPADVVKTRLQVMSGGDSRLTMTAVAQQILVKEGAKGFLSGLSARVLNIAPGCAISWAVYETVKRRLASDIV